MTDDLLWILAAVAVLALAVFGIRHHLAARRREAEAMAEIQATLQEPPETEADGAWGAQVEAAARAEEPAQDAEPPLSESFEPAPPPPGLSPEEAEAHTEAERYAALVAALADDDSTAVAAMTAQAEREEAERQAAQAACRTTAHRDVRSRYPGPASARLQTQPQGRIYGAVPSRICHR